MLEDPETVAVSYDIANCFNAFERLEMLEEMVEEHDDGTTSCMQDMARYALMSYFEDGGACAWVWVSNEDHPEGGRWHRVEAQCGVYQGRPAGPAFTALVLQRCIRRARATV